MAFSAVFLTVTETMPCSPGKSTEGVTLYSEIITDGSLAMTGDILSNRKKISKAVSKLVLIRDGLMIRVIRAPVNNGIDCSQIYRKKTGLMGSFQ